LLKTATILLRADSQKAGTVYAGDYVDHGMCKMKLNQDLIESVSAPHRQRFLWHCDQTISHHWNWQMTFIYQKAARKRITTVSTA